MVIVIYSVYNFSSSLMKRRMDEESKIASYSDHENRINSSGKNFLALALLCPCPLLGHGTHH